MDEKHYYLKDVHNRPILTLTLTTGETLIADDTQNTISNFFDVFVINNQTEPKSVVQSFGSNTPTTIRDISDVSGVEQSARSKAGDLIKEIS